MSQEQQNELSEFERALAGLTPQAALDRDRVMFEAGARSVKRGRPVMMSAATLVLGLALGGVVGKTWQVSPPTSVHETVVVEKVEPVAPPAPTSCVVLQRRILSSDFGTVGPLAKAESTSTVEDSSLGALRARMLPGAVPQ